jgi:hypothetical protein
MIIQKTQTGTRLDSKGELKPIYGADLSSIHEKLHPYCSPITLNPDQETYTVTINYPEEIDGVPLKITAVQGRVRLIQMGKLEEVLELINDSPITVQTTWEYAIDWEYHSPLVGCLKNQMNWTEEDLDNFFIEAKKI